MERPVSRRASALTPTSSSPAAPDMYQRPYPATRASSTSSPLLEGPSNHFLLPRASPRLTPILPLTPQQPPAYFPPQAPMGAMQDGATSDSSPKVCGMPLKYVSLVTLAVQNAAMSIVMHYSRVSTTAAKSYSPATAVLLNELLKGSISLLIAFLRVSSSEYAGRGARGWFPAFRKVCREIFSPDCWKLSIPALLYVVQNSLQFVAVSNLPVATFQVTYQMKILTTAAFSVMMLRKRLSSTKWLSLFFLAIGVGIVQIQSSSSQTPKPRVVGSAQEYHVHVMNPLKGFGAVTAACFTSGLAGVYFEMVLKNSKADLWVRNVQLSLFSLIPAILPIMFETRGPHAREGIFANLLRNFGGWAWATVAVQVLGGLITAVVIKYSDNILKGFATSLSIVLSFLASVALFGFHITPSFLIGSCTVLAATFMYNQPPGQELVAITKVMPGRAPTPSFPPVSPKAPILGQFPKEKTSGSPFGSPRIIASALGLGPEKSHEEFGETLDTARYLSAPYGSPYPSRTPSPYTSRPNSPIPAPLHPPPQNPGQMHGWHPQ